LSQVVRVTGEPDLEGYADNGSVGILADCGAIIWFAPYSLN